MSVLDGLRGFAALMVVVGHCAAFGFLPGFLSGGLAQMAVMLFFGLSGFLMAYLYGDKTLNSASLKEYAINRATRVLTLYYVVATFVALCFIVFDLSLLQAFSWTDVAGNMLLLKGSSVLWTIPVELHFYVVFAVLWFASRYVKFSKLVILLGILQFISMLILHLNGIDYSPILYSWLHIFLFGSLVGHYYQPLRNALDNSKFSAHFTTFGWLVLLLAVIAPPQLRRDFGFSTMVNYVDPVTTGYPMLLLVCAVFSLGPFSIFKLPILRWFGTISYSLYLLHAFVIDGVVALADRGVIPLELGFPVVLSVATLLAAASFYWFEQPAQRKLRSYLSRKQRQTSFA